DYTPSKPTVLSLAIALELNLDKTNDLLRKAGFALSHSNKFDIIIEYFISNQIYDIYKINETLFSFDQNILRT
ncbi:MAG: RNase III inhibitor, partial [Intestinibacter bartlettii]|nr:RNase III inhibitor [Intestinibacter bartlettii]